MDTDCFVYDDITYLILCHSILPIRLIFFSAFSEVYFFYHKDAKIAK